LDENTTLRERIIRLVDAFAYEASREAEELRRQIDMIKERSLFIDEETENSLTHYLRDIRTDTPYHNADLERLRQLAVRLRERKKRRGEETEED